MQTRRRAGTNKSEMNFKMRRRKQDLSLIPSKKLCCDGEAENVCFIQAFMDIHGAWKRAGSSAASGYVSGILAQRNASKSGPQIMLRRRLNAIIDRNVSGWRLDAVTA